MEDIHVKRLPFNPFLPPSPSSSLTTTVQDQQKALDSKEMELIAARAAALEQEQQARSVREVEAAHELTRQQLGSHVEALRQARVSGWERGACIVRKGPPKSGCGRECMCGRVVRPET